jgi:NTP pyrophosphatase (non-canonical NTP hydrolase)
MIDFKTLQKDILDNKVTKGFNTTDMNEEFIHAHEELAEASAAYRKKLPDLGEELADVTIYLLGIAEILGIDLEREIVAKMEKNRKREYSKIDGVPVRTKDA